VTTLRFRSAAGRLPYAQALLALTEHARVSDRDFDFGPDTLASLEEQGLVIAGPDLAEEEQLLRKVAGLHVSDE
jgi:hypothetical protein